MSGKDRTDREKDRSVAAPDLDERHERRKPTPGEAGAGAAITGIPPLSTHKKRGQQIEKDRSREE